MADDLVLKRFPHGNSEWEKQDITISFLVK